MRLQPKKIQAKRLSRRAKQLASKQQVIVVHGGETFQDYKSFLKYLRSADLDLDRIAKKSSGWKDHLPNRLGSRFDVLLLQMPNKMNAKFTEWSIWFKKILPFLRNHTILVGHSLGGIFLVKFLSQNNLPIKVKGLFLVASPFEDEKGEYTLADFRLPKNLNRLHRQVEHIFIYHSTDDGVVNFRHQAKYKSAIPQAVVRVFRSRGHFLTPNFPELLKDIRSI